MRIFKYLFTILILIIPELLSATGPSYIVAKINPIRVNNRGDILCRTKFESNWMGAHYYMNINYGLCVLTKGSILEYPIFKLEMPKNEKDEIAYIKLNTFWNSWFENNRSEADTITKEEAILIQKYSFNNSELEQYKRTDTISIKQFEQQYKVDLTKTNLKTLEKAYSLPFISEPENSKMDIIISFDFGNIVITNNGGFDDSKIGLGYSYTFPFAGHDMSFDIQDINGVLFDVKRK